MDLHQALYIEHTHRRLLLLGLADYPHDDMLGVRYNPVDFGVGKNPGTPHRRARIAYARFTPHNVSIKWFRSSHFTHKLVYSTL